MTELVEDSGRVSNVVGGLKTALGRDQLFGLVLDNLPQKVFVKDRASGYLLCNRAFSDGLGIRPEEFVGKDDFAFFPRELAEKYRQDDQAVMAGGAPVSIIEKYLEKGRESYVQTVKAPLRDESGSVIGLLGLFWDVTEQVRAEQALRESEERYRTLVETIDDAICVKDVEGRYVVANAEYARRAGRMVADVLGKTAVDLYGPQRGPEIYAEDRELLANGQPIEAEVENPSRQRARICLDRKVPIRNGAGEVVGLVVVSRDVTERRRSEEVMQRQAQEILDLSTPVVQLWDGVVALPLIGTLDSQRTQQVMEQLLDRIVETRSTIALVDITGVPAIDTQTARHLIETITAVRLLGAQVILTGIRPAIAQTMVHLGIDLSGVTTRASMAAGLRVALDLLGQQVARKG